MEEGYNPYNNDPTRKENLEADTIDIDASNDHLKETLSKGVPENKEWVDGNTRRSNQTSVREDRYREST